nr:Ig-like domain-containing protein [Pelagerythrobacter marinus]
MSVATTTDSDSTSYVLAVGTFSETYAFAVAGGTQVDTTFTLTADSIATVLSDVEFTLQRERPDGSFEDVASTSGGGLLDLLTLDILADNQVRVSADDLAPGNYRVVYEGGGLLSAGITLTLDAEFRTTTADGDPVTGNVLANDVNVSGSETLEIDTGGGTFVTVTDGLVVAGTYGTLVINADGSYTYTPSDDANGVGETEVFTYRLVNADGSSDSATLTIELVAADTTPPDAPTADVDDATGTTVTGTAEAGATITVYAPDGITVLGTGTADASGNYSVTIPAQTNGEDLLVTATDAAGNESTPTMAEAPDLTPPDAPTANVDDATGTTVTGTAEAGATITVYAPDGITVLGTGTANAGGSYSVTIPAQTNGEDLLVTATDAAGNESGTTPVQAPDLTPPDAPTADVDDATGTTVTGTAEAGATITVHAPDGITVLGTGTADAGGSYSVTIPAQTDGELLQVTATDAAGNVSAATTATAPDLLVAVDNEATLFLDVTPETSDQPLQSATVGALLDLGVAGDTVDVSVLGGSNFLTFAVSENATRQVSVDGEGAALLDLSLFGDSDFDLVVYRVEDGSSTGTRVYTATDWLVGSGGILGANWTAAELALPEFSGGATYYVTIGNAGGLLDASLLNDLSIRSTSDQITEYEPPATVSGTVAGNVILDAGIGGTDVAPAGTVVSEVNGTAIAAGGTAIVGTYGTLTVNPDGSYSYVADTSFTGAYGDTDSFLYTLVSPGGDTETATLTVTLDFAGPPDGAAAFAASSAMEPDVVPLGDFGLMDAGLDGSVGSPMPGSFEMSSELTMEDNGSLATILDRYLLEIGEEAAPRIAAGEDNGSATGGADAGAGTGGATDPLGYLDTRLDDDLENGGFSAV